MRKIWLCAAAVLFAGGLVNVGTPLRRRDAVRIYRWQDVDVTGCSDPLSYLNGRADRTRRRQPAHLRPITEATAQVLRASRRAAPPPPTPCSSARRADVVATDSTLTGTSDVRTPARCTDARRTCDANGRECPQFMSAQIGLHPSDEPADCSRLLRGTNPCDDLARRRVASRRPLQPLHRRRRTHPRAAGTNRRAVRDATSRSV